MQAPWVGRFVDPVMATGYHMLLGGVPLLALSLYREGGDLAQRLPELTGACCCASTSWLLACASAAHDMKRELSSPRVHAIPLGAMPSSALYQRQCSAPAEGHA
jgi:hypothetical protein